ncbi:MAG TPA: phospholipase D-like domain-containing protein [Candidatus Acidoferrum sp.]|nr:phospholipase D-like domain-containing protein [Candidatus Acidoferrum sp.]
MSNPSSIVVHDRVFTVKAYRGDECVMLAMNLPQSACGGLAGFAIARGSDATHLTYIKNRLSFDPKKGAYATKDPLQELADEVPSNQAPFQKFRWVDFPPDASAPLTYKVDAMYFSGSAAAAKYSVTFQMEFGGELFASFNLGFTRGYISSQDFADRYGAVRELRPNNTVDYDTDATVPKSKPPVTWRVLYEWLGAHARALLADFTQRCKADGHGFDVFAYDLDEPDFIKFVAQQAEAKVPVRMILDNSTLHTKPTAREVQSAALLTKAGVDLKRGHFARYAHSKCVIERDAPGNAIRVLTGSANFSVRGLYVQSNSVITIDDPQVAGLYGQAFDEAWNDMAQFQNSEIASGWFDAQGTGIPAFSVSFAPHKSGDVSLDRVAAAIRNAKSSVLFAVMDLDGGGAVMQELTNLMQRSDLFSYGITQTLQGIKYYKSSAANGVLVPFSYLQAHVPPPFTAEWNAGFGQVIHHKFVVIDFNQPSPLVYCGSSNLSQGGEQDNGDNLLEIRDPSVAVFYAIEAIKLVDHYEFRALEQSATQSEPLVLQGGGAATPWWQSSFDVKNIKNTERELFVS